MQRMHQHLNDINDMRDELIASNMHMQQQINDVRDAVRALEHRSNEVKGELNEIMDRKNAVGEQSASAVRGSARGDLSCTRLGCGGERGAGSAENEVALLHAMGNVGGCLCTDGVRKQQVAFLDTCFTTRSLQNVKCYADGLSDQQPRPALLFSFKDLTTFLQRQHAMRPEEQFIVLGINAGMTMNSSEELYECHRFLCQCAEWAAGGAMHQQYMNFMGDANHWRVPGRSVHLGTGLWCYQSPWWELAKAIITDTSAELLLLGRRTA
eukprot:gene31899-biopygen5698